VKIPGVPRKVASVKPGHGTKHAINRDGPRKDPLLGELKIKNRTKPEEGPDGKREKPAGPTTWSRRGISTEKKSFSIALIPLVGKNQKTEGGP